MRKLNEDHLEIGNMSLGWHKQPLNTSKRGGYNDQTIVEHIRNAVLMQRLPPNTKLPEITLGEVFGVSRSVVRKALTRLAAEHVINQRPNQVARVRAPTVEETRETFSARRLIEGEIVALLAGKLGTDTLATLNAQVEDEKQAYARKDEPARIEHSLTIHHSLAEYASNRILGTMLTDLILRTSIVIALYKRPTLASCYLEDDHATLMVHLANGDAEGARQCVHAHLHSLEALLDLSPRGAETDLKAILGGKLAQA